MKQSTAANLHLLQITIYFGWQRHLSTPVWYPGGCMKVKQPCDKDLICFKSEQSNLHIRFHVWVCINTSGFLLHSNRKRGPWGGQTPPELSHTSFMSVTFTGGVSLRETSPKIQQKHKSHQLVTVPLGSHSHLGQPLEIQYGCDHNTGANSHHVCQLAMKWQTGDEMWAED